MDVNAKLIGQIIQEYRKKANLSQEVVSGLADLDRTHYSKIERGERMPTITTLFKIARALEIHPSDIVKTIETRTNYKL
ncbi:MAG: helix-turn-helix transcriptional regulator [Oscillospiraceae bacterium]|nr:helix-turn-helix transcriptional regulator [Oscillospiraceae bacterium]